MRATSVRGVLLDRARRVGGTTWGVRTIGRWVSPLQRRVFRLTGGRVSLTGGAPVLLLTTTGRRTGLERTVPLLYLRDGARLVVCNVNPGFEGTNPWVLNLRARPQARVERRGDTHEVTAREVTAEEMDGYWPALVGLWPAYRRFHDRGGARSVFVLEPASPG